jgi:F-type H+-transporting ATPase subunit alpha
MKAQPNELSQTLSQTFEVLDRAVKQFRLKPESKEVGTITYVGSGVVRVVGLSGVSSEELLRFAGDCMGMAFNVDQKEIGVVLLDEGDELAAGTEVRRTGRLMDVPVGEDLLGRVVDAQGRPLLPCPCRQGSR